MWLTQYERDDTEDDQAKHRPDVAIAQVHADQLCKRIAERHETQATEGYAHEEN